MPKMRGSIFDFKPQCNKENMVITVEKILNIFDKNLRGFSEDRQGGKNSRLNLNKPFILHLTLPNQVFLSS